MARRYRPADFLRLADEIGDKLDRFALDFQTRLVLAGFNQIILRSPVWQPRPTDPPWYSKIPGGTLRASWQIDFDSPSFKLPSSPDFTGQRTLSDGLTKLGSAKRPRKVWISTAMPYASTIEFGRYPNPPRRGTGRTVGGFSTQAPKGMVRQSFRYMVDASPGIATALFAERFAL
jgi:hypothetical protein